LLNEAANAESMSCVAEAIGGILWVISALGAEQLGRPICCPVCAKPGIRLVAFTDATGHLHLVGAARLRVSVIGVPPTGFLFCPQFGELGTVNA
jgi:hypothetical protein